MNKQPSDNTNELRNLIDQVCNTGRLSLRKKIQDLGEYTIEKYADKNQHITPEVEGISKGLHNNNLFDILERYWMSITDETEKINKSRKNKLNRGISLGNTGVFQIAQTKINEGIFNLYRALVDDQEVLEKVGLESDPEKNLVDIPLFTQFEDPVIEKLHSDVLVPNVSKEETLPTIAELKLLLKNQQPAKRLFIFGKLSLLFSSLRKNAILENMMSRQAVLESLSALCLWMEDSLRSKEKSITDLYNGLVFLGLPSFEGGNKSTNLNALMDKISTAEKEKDLQVRRALVSILIRNYSNHNLESNSHVFFNEKRILSYVAAIFFTMLLLDSKGKI